MHVLAQEMLHLLAQADGFIERRVGAGFVGTDLDQVLILFIQ